MTKLYKLVILKY